MPILLICSLVELRAEADDAQHAFFFVPDGIEAADALSCPQRPAGFKFIGVIVVQNFGRFRDCGFGL